MYEMDMQSCDSCNIYSRIELKCSNLTTQLKEPAYELFCISCVFPGQNYGLLIVKYANVKKFNIFRITLFFLLFSFSLSLCNFHFPIYLFMCSCVSTCSRCICGRTYMGACYDSYYLKVFNGCKIAI